MAIYYAFINIVKVFLKNIDIYSIITIISAIATICISILGYIIARNTKKRDDKKNNDDIIKSASLTYDYLIEILNKFKHTLTYKSMAYKSITYQPKYGESLVDLNNNVLNKNEIKYLRELYDLIKRYYDGQKALTIYDDLPMKWIYKKIFDLNILEKNINNEYEHEKIEFVANLEVLEIICKLKKVINVLEKEEIYKCDAQKILIKDEKGKIYIKKEYRNESFISNDNGINGYIKQYETIFVFDGKKMFTLSDIIYDGKIENNKFNGEGTYYYYSKDNFKSKDKINSCDLIKDDCAIQIKGILKNNAIDVNSRAIFKGIFKKGIIDKGVLKYESIDSKGEIEILNI